MQIAYISGLGVRFRTAGREGNGWAYPCRLLVAGEAPNEELAKGGAAPLALSSPGGKEGRTAREREREREGERGSGVWKCGTEGKEQTVKTEEGALLSVYRKKRSRQPSNGPLVSKPKPASNQSAPTTSRS
jgi:hypothetical protein